MDLNEFVKTMQEAGDVKENMVNITDELLKSIGIGYYKGNSLEAFLKGKRRPVLKNISVNVDGFVQYFNKNTKRTWKKMQKAFAEKDECGFVNRDTTDAEIFYRSLLALLWDILRFPPTSLHHILPAKPLLFGRNGELKQIEDAFKENNYVVLTGIAGIGKSQTALAYAHKMNESGGWIIQHVICEDTDTLRDSVNKLQVDSLYGQNEIAEKDEQKIFNNKHDFTTLKIRPLLKA